MNNYQQEFTNASLPLDADKIQIQQLQLEKINFLIQKIVQTSDYYKNLSLPSSFRSLDEFSEIVPITTKENIIANHADFVRKDINIGRKPAITTTTGSTGKPLSIFRTIDDYYYSANMKRILKANGIVEDSEIRFIIPKSSSIWNGRALLTIIFPNFQLWSPEYFEYLLSHPSKGNKTKLAKIDMIFSWTRIPPSILKRNENLISFLKPKLMLIGGEKMTDEIMSYCRNMLPQTTVHDLYATIELGWVTTMCKKDHMHIVEDTFYPEIINQDEDSIGELVCTFLYPLTMNFLRYNTGDLVKEISCDCGNTGKAIKFIGRVKHEEIDKHFTKEHVQLAIDSSPTIVQFFKPEKIAIKLANLLDKVILTIIIPFKHEPTQTVKEKAISEFNSNLAKEKIRKVQEGIWQIDLEFASENDEKYKNLFIDGKIKVFNL